MGGVVLTPTRKAKISLISNRAHVKLWQIKLAAQSDRLTHTCYPPNMSQLRMAADVTNGYGARITIVMSRTTEYSITTTTATPFDWSCLNNIYLGWWNHSRIHFYRNPIVVADSPLDMVSIEWATAAQIHLRANAPIRSLGRNLHRKWYDLLEVLIVSRLCSLQIGQHGKSRK